MRYQWLSLLQRGYVCPVYGDDVHALAGFTTDHGRKTTVVITVSC